MFLELGSPTPSLPGALLLASVKNPDAWVDDCEASRVSQPRETTRYLSNPDGSHPGLVGSKNPQETLHSPTISQPGLLSKVCLPRAVFGDLGSMAPPTGWINPFTTKMNLALPEGSE